jgi:methylase of polypeptide subunit release factors
MRSALVSAGYAGPLPLQRADVRPTELSGYTPTGKKLAVALRRTAAGEPVDVLARLFLLGLTVPTADAAGALAASGLEPWLECGVLVRDGDGVRSTCQLAPVRGLYLATDAQWRPATGPMHVVGYANAPDTLARATIRRRAGRVLDIGTGCGIQALLAAAHADEVVATDTNPRCLAYTRFNAALNGITNVVAREGDLFAPVAGERFDLIVSNPPFVISPEREFAFRDSGRPGDTLLHELIAAAPEHLNPGGYCQFPCEWAEREGEPAEERVAEWVRASGCDALVLTFRRATPADHAEQWATTLSGEGPAALAARMTRWIDWYAAEGISRIAVGLFVLRKRAAGAPWVRFEDAPRFGADTGASIERRFAAEDFLESHPGPALFSARLKVPRGVLWEQQLTATTDGWQVTDAQLRVKDGLAFLGTPNEYVIGLLDRCRGGRTLAEVLDDLERALGAELDREGAVGVVRTLVAQGFLVPDPD